MPRVIAMREHDRLVIRLPGGEVRVYTLRISKRPGLSDRHIEFDEQPPRATDLAIWGVEA